ncbi:Sortase family protein [Bifidobacterium sp. DSM 109958]|uniref:Sortase family protein n=1 Tax=Bifidobacterium moraviense TaxID=2675323 RepID=A0A7Y0F2I5_9BIFI|nr:class E sortase [Bifidobacterium sp. DSM 109958]NMN00855.1 Sortase family protein [Bifidobacterium sp. DSM 109958]
MARHGSGGSGRNIRVGGVGTDGGAERRSPGLQAVGIVGEILLTLAVVCGLYVAWQMWWTGVESERTQLATRQSVSWSDPAAGNGGGTVTIAAAQEGDPPAQPQDPGSGDLIAQLYIPRFGTNWQRNIVEGVDAEQLARHGLGHYPTSQLPGQTGNFAVAGHRAGYGEPLAYVDQLQEGDPIIIRTQDYWYVYRYTNHKITVPTDVGVVTADPSSYGAYPAQNGRYVTLTTCEPRYSPTPATHRWISWGTFDYWAKVSDGVPKELAATDASGQVRFAVNETPSPLARLDSLRPVVAWLLVAYAVIYVAALVAWRYPMLRAIRSGARRRPDASLYGWLMRRQPGPLPVRIVLAALLFTAAGAALFEWAFPWAAANIPILQAMSTYVAVQ